MVYIVHFTFGPEYMASISFKKYLEYRFVWVHNSSVWWSMPNASEDNNVDDLTQVSQSNLFAMYLHRLLMGDNMTCTKHFKSWHSTKTATVRFLMLSLQLSTLPVCLWIDSIHCVKVLNGLVHFSLIYSHPCVSSMGNQLAPFRCSKVKTCDQAFWNTSRMGQTFPVFKSIFYIVPTFSDLGL